MELYSQSATGSRLRDSIQDDVAPKTSLADQLRWLRDLVDIAHQSADYAEMMASQLVCSEPKPAETSEPAGKRTFMLDDVGASLTRLNQALLRLGNAHHRLANAIGDSK